MKQVILYNEPGRFAGWPANNGVWNWGDEIVVGFTAGYMDLSITDTHPISTTQPAETIQARSLDGGETWERVPFSDLVTSGGDPTECPGGIDFTHPDFAMKSAGAQFLVSTDRCRSWQGPWRIPDFGQKGIMARTDYQVVNRDEAFVFLTATRPDGTEGRVFVARLSGGGSDWEFLTWIGPEFPEYFVIMPSSVRLVGGTYIAALRCRHVIDDEECHYIDLYASDDECRTWRYVNRPVPNLGGGNPPSMIRMADGRIALTYGYRRPPFGVRARVSDDEGYSWGPEIILRDQGGDNDLGYPRTVQRADGKLVTMYYFNEDARGERSIQATIWDVDEVMKT
jgi:hypothetical protein